MLVAQPLLHLFLTYHMAQITTYCRRLFFFTLMQRKLNTVHMLELNAVLQMKLGYSSCVCVYKEGPLPQIILIIELYLPADACNQQNMAAGFYVPSCSQLLG